MSNYILHSINFTVTPFCNFDQLQESDKPVGKYPNYYLGKFIGKTGNELKSGTQPIIIVLACQLYHAVPAEWQPLLDAGRLLVISTTDSPRQSRATALARNRYVATIAQQIVLAGVNETSSLYCFYEDYKDKIANLPTF